MGIWWSKILLSSLEDSSLPSHIAVLSFARIFRGLFPNTYHLSAEEAESLSLNTIPASVSVSLNHCDQRVHKRAMETLYDSRLSPWDLGWNSQIQPGSSCPNQISGSWKRPTLRKIFRLYQGRWSRRRLTRFETEGVLPNKETIRGTPPSEFTARVLLQKEPSGTREHSNVCKIYAPTSTVGSKVMPSSTQWSVSPFSIVSFSGTTSMDLMNLGVHSGYFEKARNWHSRTNISKCVWSIAWRQWVSQCS